MMAPEARVERIWIDRDVGEVPDRMIRSSAQFVAGFTPPDYLIDGIIQRGFIYSFTGMTGAGKTAVALLLSAHVALGLSIAGREVAQGRVLYFAGENPDDIRMRWLGMADRMGFDVATIPVHFVPGVFSIKELRERIVVRLRRWVSSP
jgi:hypothetical protein